MTKAEQEWSIIEALVYCKGKRMTKKSCAGCPYAGVGCAVDVAIAKLKSQEPVEPVYELGITRCGQCNHEIDKYGGDNYCPQCGKAVKWDE